MAAPNLKGGYDEVSRPHVVHLRIEASDEQMASWGAYVSNILNQAKVIHQYELSNFGIKFSFQCPRQSAFFLRVAMLDLQGIREAYEQSLVQPVELPPELVASA